MNFSIDETNKVAAFNNCEEFTINELEAKIKMLRLAYTDLSEWKVKFKCQSFEKDSLEFKVVEPDLSVIQPEKQEDKE